MMKNAYFAKNQHLIAIGVEILALLCPDDSIQIVLILPQFSTHTPCGRGRLALRAREFAHSHTEKTDCFAV